MAGSTKPASVKWWARISGSLFAKSGKPLLQRAGNLTVQLLPPGLEHAFVGGISYQRVLKAVDGVRRDAAAIDKLGLLKFGERMFQCGFVARDHRADPR